MPAYLSKDVLDEARSEDLRQQTARSVAQMQQQPDPPTPVPPLLDFEGLKKSLLSTWTGQTASSDAPATTPSAPSSGLQTPGPGESSNLLADPSSTAAATSGPFDFMTHARNLAATWLPQGLSQSPTSSDTSSVESTPSDSAASSAPAGSPLPAGAPTPAAMPTGQPPVSASLPDHLDTSSRDANLTQWAPALQAVQAKTGLRADALAAIIQAENGGGQSPLSATSNNYFSISAVDSPYQIGAEDATPGYGLPGRFGRYKTPQASLDHFVDLVSTSPRYAEAWANRGDPQKFFSGLVKGGYIVPEPGFPVDTWLQNLDAGRQHYNEIAPQATQPTPSGAATTQPSAMPAAASAAPTSDVDQAALDDPDKWALCGPVAAVIAAGRRGANWTVAQAKQISQAANLWDAGNGMHGLQSEVDLLNKMNIPAKTGSADPQTLISEAQSGNTPIVSTNNHYFVLTGYDPATGTFDTTTTGGVYKAGGRRMTLDQIERVGGGIQGAAYFDNPSSPTPSVAASPAPVAQAQTQDTGGSPWTRGANTSDASSASPGNGSSAPDGLMLRQPLSMGTMAQADSTSTPSDASNGEMSVPAAPPTERSGTFTPERQIITTPVSDPSAPYGALPSNPAPYDPSFPDPEASRNETVPGLTTPQDAGPAQDNPYGQQKGMIDRRNVLVPNDLPPDVYGGNASLLNDAPAAAAGASTPSGPGASYPSAGAFQDDQTQSGYVQPDMAPGPPPTQPVPQPSSSPMKPLYDLGGNIMGYVHTGLDAAGNAASTASDAISAAVPQIGPALSAAGLPDVATPVIKTARGAAQGIEESMSPEGTYLNQASDLGTWIGNGIRAATGRDPVETPRPTGAVAQAMDAARRAGYALVSGSMQANVAADIWREFGLPTAEIAGLEINPGVFLVPGRFAGGGMEAAAGPAAGRVAGAIENIGDRAATAVRGAVGAGFNAASDAVRSGIGRVGSALDENAGRVAALDAERAAAGGSAPAYGTLGVVPPGGEPALIHAPDPAGAPNAGLAFTKPGGEAFTPEEIAQVQDNLAARGIEAHPTSDPSVLVIPAHDVPPGFISHVKAAVQEAGYGPSTLEAYAGETRSEAVGNRPAGIGASGDQAGAAESPGLQRAAGTPPGAGGAAAPGAADAGERGYGDRPYAGAAVALPDSGRPTAAGYPQVGSAGREVQPVRGAEPVAGQGAAPAYRTLGVTPPEQSSALPPSLSLPQEAERQLGRFSTVERPRDLMDDSFRFTRGSEDAPIFIGESGRVYSIGSQSHESAINDVAAQIGITLPDPKQDLRGYTDAERGLYGEFGLIRAVNSRQSVAAEIRSRPTSAQMQVLNELSARAEAMGKPFYFDVHNPDGSMGAFGRGSTDMRKAINERFPAPSPRSTSTYGVFGVAPPEAGQAAADVARPRFVPPEVRMRTTPNMELPDDPRFAQAVEAHGGRITPDGAEVYVTRAQGADAAGKTATRGGVFIEAVPEGGQSSYARTRDDPNAVGGSQVLPPTKTLYRKPIVLDNEPGTAQGFDQAMERLGQNKTTELEALRSRGRDAVIRMQDAESQAGYRSPEAEAARTALHEIQAEFERIQGQTATSDLIDRGIGEAHAAGPPGSPARAQALKDLVSRYGGDPNTIDDLLKIRADTQAESQWAIKENIVAGNARRQGVDGVFTIKNEEPTWAEISKHPSMQPFNAAADAAQVRLDAADQAIQRYGERYFNEHPDAKGMAAYETPEYKQLQQESHAAGLARSKARDAALKQGEKIKREIPSSKIKEVFDVQQGRNPTPGAPDPQTVERAQAELDRLRREWRDTVEQLGGTRPDDTLESFLSRQIPEVQAEAARISRRADELRAVMTRTGAPGYSLHPDLARPTAPEAASTTAAGTAGVVPIPMRTAGDVGASVAASKGFFDKATPILSQGVASAVSGGVGAATADQLGDPNDPNRALKGFVAGAVAPYAISRGAGALARGLGRDARGAEGALAALGHVPEEAPAYRPTAPEGFNRMYHGTASDFPSVNPDQLNRGSLYRRGYYLTSDPRVAGGIVNDAGDVVSAGYAQQRNTVAGVQGKILRDQADAARAKVDAWKQMVEDYGDDPARGPYARQKLQEAQQIYDDAQGKLYPDAGPNVRPVDVPHDLNLVRADAPLDQDLLDNVDNVITQQIGRNDPEAARALGDAYASLQQWRKNPNATNDWFLQSLMGAADNLEYQRYGEKGDLFTQLLQNAGYNGIEHSGGKRVPMLDSAGAPIEHTVNVIFPDAVGKVRNALSGTYGGATLGPVAPEAAQAGSGVLGRGGLLDAANRQIGSAVAGGTAGAAVGAGTDQEDPGRGARRGALIGAGLALAGHNAMRVAGAREGGALQTMGPVPPANLPPRVQQAVQQAQQQPGLHPLDWTRRFLGEVGYSSMIGPATATVNLMGNLMEPLYGAPKELARGASRAIQTGNASALREPGEMARGALYGLTQTGTAMLDALMSRGRYAATPGHEPLSHLTNNPIGKAITTGLEAGGRVFSAIPDAFFGSIAEHAGEARAAAQVATDLGHTGAQWKQTMASLLNDAQQVKAGTLTNPSPEVIRVIKDGQAFAKRQTFQDPLGTEGKKWKYISSLGDTPVLGSMLTPFFNTPWNMATRMAERTPLGLAMNSQASRFDKRYDAVVGSAMLAGMGALATNGTITGSGPNDPQKRSEMRSQGWRPYSTLINGVYVPNRVLGIYGPLMNGAGDLHDAIAYAKDKSPGSITGDFLGRTGQQLQQQPYLQGLSNLMQAMQAGQGGGLGSGVERYVSSNLTRMVPYAATARAIGTAEDPLERTTNQGKNVPATQTVAEQVRSGIGNRQGFESLGQQPLPAAQDVLGQPQANQQSGAKALFAKTSSEQAQPVIEQFQRANVDIPFPRQNVQYLDTPLEMSKDEQRAWNEARGAYLVRVATPLATSGSLDRLPPARREERLQGLLSDAADAADRAVLNQIGPGERARRRKEALDAAKLGKAS